MIRRLLPITIAALALTSGSARAQDFQTISDSGGSVDVVRDADGLTYVAWVTDSGPSTTTINFCRLEADGCRSGTERSFPGVEGGNVRRLYLLRGAGSRLVIVHTGCCPQRTNAYVSNDLGGSWGAGVDIGSVTPTDEGVVLGPGDTVSLLGFGNNTKNFQNAPVGGPKQTAQVNLSTAPGLVYDDSIALTTDSRPVTVWSDGTSSYVSAYDGAGDINTTSDWFLPPVELTGVTGARLAGGPKGVKAIWTRAGGHEVAAFNGVQFGEGAPLPNATDSSGAAAIDQDAAGGVHVVFERGADLCYAYAADGTSFLAPRLVARDVHTPYVLRVSAAGAGNGQAVWSGSPLSNTGGVYAADLATSLEPNVCAVAPTAVSSEIVSVGHDSAVMRVVLRPRGQASTVTVRYGTTPDYGQTATASAPAADGEITVDVPLTGLMPSTLHHAYAVVSTASGAEELAPLTFTTTDAPPPPAISQVFPLASPQTPAAFFQAFPQFSPPPAVFAPDFKLEMQPAEGVGVAPGKAGGRILFIEMTRGDFSQLGRIQLSVAGKFKSMPGVTVSGPTFTTPQAVDEHLVALTASSTAQQGTGTIPIRAVAIDHPQKPDAQIAIPVTVGGVFDLAIDSIEVTQGVGPDLPLPLASPAKWHETINLVSNSRTAIRVFAHASAPKGTKLAATVQVRRKGGGPWLNPIRKGRLVNVVQEGYTPDKVRDFYAGLPKTTIKGSGQDNGIWTFEVQETTGLRSYEARILSNIDTLSQNVSECATDLCKSNNTFELQGVVFTPQKQPRIKVLTGIWHDGEKNHLAPSTEVAVGRALDGVRNVVPGGDGMNAQFLGGIGFNYEGSAAHKDCRAKKYEDTACAKLLRTTTLDNLEDAWGDAIEDGDAGLMVMMRNFPGVARGPLALVNVNRPLTSVAHEMGHNLGLMHSDTLCGGADYGEAGAIYTDSYGGLIGAHGFQRLSDIVVDEGLLSRRFRADFTDPGASAEQFNKDFQQRLDWLAKKAWTADPAMPTPSVRAAANRTVDFMSYCFLSERRTWVALQTWYQMRENILQGKVGEDREARAARTLSQAAPAPVEVTAIQELDGSGVRLAGTQPVTGTVGAGGQPSDVRLQARGPAGQMLADVPMVRQRLHGHPEPSAWYALKGAVPAPAGATSLELARGGQVVATHRVSPNAPTVSVTAPRARFRQRAGKALKVTWRSADKDGPGLNAKVELSTDGGRRWETVFRGQDTGRASVPATAIPYARRARVRVTITDDVHAAQALSGVFRTDGSAPRVRIVDSSKTVAAGEALFAAGEATDDRGSAITGKRLVWRLGRKSVGTGSRLQVRDPAGGRQRLTLTATDYRGRRRTVTRTIRITRPKPALSLFELPATVARGARSVRIAVAALRPGTLQLGRRTVRLRERRTTVTVPVRGSGRVRIRYVLRMGGSVKRGTVSIARG